MLNHIALLGRLTDNPVLRTVSSGINNAKFTLAVNRDFKNKDTGDYETDFIDITCWRGTADFVSKYFTKGQLVVVEGRLEINSYTDKEGVRRRAANVVASQVHFAESRRDSGNFTPAPYGGAQAPAYGGQAPQQQQQQPQQGFGQAPQQQAYSEPSYQGGGYTAPQPQGNYSQPASGYSAGSYSLPNQEPRAPQAETFRTLSPEEEQQKDFPF